MRPLVTRKNRPIVALITIACLLVDAGLLAAFGSAILWLAGVASGYVLAGLAVVGLIAVRVFQMIRHVRHVQGPVVKLC